MTTCANASSFAAKKSTDWTSAVRRALLTTLFTAMVPTAYCWAAPFDTAGKVIHVDDGDTIILLTEGNAKSNIRLSSIDAPESPHTQQVSGRVGQPFSDKSGKFLASKVLGQMVNLHCFESDRYGRKVCELFLGGVSINREMVKQGWAWANQSANGRYLRDNSLIALEATARSTRLGLWAGADPVAPWEWRKVCWSQGQCGQ